MHDIEIYTQSDTALASKVFFYIFFYVVEKKRAGTGCKVNHVRKVDRRERDSKKDMKGN